MCMEMAGMSSPFEFPEWMEDEGYEVYSCNPSSSNRVEADECGMGVLDPFRLNPENILLEKEMFNGLLEIIRNGGAPEKILAFLDPEGIKAMTKTGHRRLYRGVVTAPGVTEPEIVRRLLAILGQVIGWEETEKLVDRLAEAAGQRRAKEEDPAKYGRVPISAEARKLPLDKLHAAIRAAGYKISRPTAWRAKQHGWFSYGYHKKHEGSSKPTSSAVGVVNLTEEEKGLSGSEIGRRFGVSAVTGSKARQRGWFQVDKKTLAKGKVPPERLESVLQAA